MNERTAVAGGILTAMLVAGGILAAMLVAGGAAVAFDSPVTFFGFSPLGAALYLGIAVALPQGVLAQQDGSRDRAVVAGLAATAGAAMVGYGVVTGTLTADEGGVLGPLLIVAIVLAVVVGTVRSFRAGYDSARR